MQFDIRRLDIYRKVPKDLTQPTFTGAVISLCAMLFMAFLFLSELNGFLAPEIISELMVDDPVRDEARIPVQFDVTLPKMKCEFLGLDIQDDLGRHEVGFVDNTVKTPINEEQGCRFKAEFKVNKVPGNFHISTHSSRKQPDNPDMTHIVHYIHFGDVVEENRLTGSFNPLKEVDRTQSNDTRRVFSALSTHDYFIKIVPTKYEIPGQQDLFPYQYTFAHRDYLQYGHGHRVTPAIWFRYDLTPITVRYSSHPKPLYSFLTTVCAIVGGTFTVAGIIDSMIYTAAEVFKKAELGKLS